MFHIYRIMINRMLRRLPGTCAPRTLTQSRSLRRKQKTYLHLSFWPYRNRRRPANHPRPRPPVSPLGFQTMHGKFCLPRWQALRCQGAGGWESLRPSVCKPKVDRVFTRCLVFWFLLFPENSAKESTIGYKQEKGR